MHICIYTHNYHHYSNPYITIDIVMLCLGNIIHKMYSCLSLSLYIYIYVYINI